MAEKQAQENCYTVRAWAMRSSEGSYYEQVHESLELALSDIKALVDLDDPHEIELQYDPPEGSRGETLLLATRNDGSDGLLVEAWSLRWW